MPIYEYVCLDCRNRFEVIRSMREADDPIDCEACHSEHTSRMLTVFYAHSSGKVVAGNGGCSSCSGGSCASCNH